MRRGRRRRNRQKEWRFLLLAGIFLLIGTGIFSYPMISNYIAEKQQENVIQGYEESIISSDKKQLKKEWEKAKKYNAKGQIEYWEVLNIDDNGVMGHIEIPKINARIPIYHGADEKSLEKGVGHVKETSLPIGGTGNHALLIGHRGLPNAELFTRLDELKMKDLFFIHVLDQTLAYEVNQIQVVLPVEIDHVQAQEDQDLVTLVTCTPYGVNSHRLMITGKRTKYIQDQSEKSSEKRSLFQSLSKKAICVGIMMGSILLAALSRIVFLGKKKRRRRKREKN